MRTMGEKIKSFPVRTKAPMRIWDEVRRRSSFERSSWLPVSRRRRSALRESRMLGWVSRRNDRATSEMTLLLSRC